MIDKFNFYDFVAYIIPGAGTLALMYWLYVGVFRQPFTLTIDTLGESIIFLAAAYFVGHVVQGIRHVITKWLPVKIFEDQYSEQFLCPKDTHFTEAFRTDLVNAIKQVFNLSLTSSDTGQAQKRRDAFKLCYSLIVQEGDDAHTALFNGMDALLRGMSIVLGMAILVAIASIIRNVFVGDGLQWWLGIAVLVAIAISLILVVKRANSFSELFAESVYRSFYAWYSSKRLDQAGAGSGL